MLAVSLLALAGGAGGVTLSRSRPACAIAGDLGLACFESPSAEYMRKTVALMRDSVYRHLFLHSVVLKGSCADHGYDVLLGPSDCFQEWTLSVESCTNFTDIAGEQVACQSRYALENSLTLEDAMGRTPCDVGGAEQAARRGAVNAAVAEASSDC